MANERSYQPNLANLPVYSQEDLQRFADTDRLRNEVVNGVWFLNLEQLTSVKEVIDTMRANDEGNNA